MMRKIFGKESGKKPPTQNQHAAGDTENNRPPGNPDTGAVGASGGSLTLDKSGLMNTPLSKQKQNKTETKQFKWFGSKSGKKPPTQNQNAAGDTGNNLPPGNPATGAVGATGGSFTQDKPGLIKTQWRKLEQNEQWTKQYAEKLLDDIQKHCDTGKDISNIRILLLGSVGAGKSSFLNTVASIDIERIAQITSAGGADGSVTFALKEYCPKYKLKNFQILDTMGVEDNDQGGLNLKDALNLVKGHISPNYMFNPATPIDERSKEFRPEPKDREKIHCVVFVIDATVAGNDNISDGRRNKIKELQRELRTLDIPRIVLLTKIDVLCELVDEDIENTYKSEKVKDAVNVAKELYNVPEQNVFPVQNYEDEMEPDCKKEILPLLALRQMIYFGSDFLNHK